jgi:hypothetical protein
MDCCNAVLGPEVLFTPILRHQLRGRQDAADLTRHLSRPMQTKMLFVRVTWFRVDCLPLREGSDFLLLRALDGRGRKIFGAIGTAERRTRRVCQARDASYRLLSQ